MKIYTDFLVLGSGIAGLSYALKVAEYGKVTLISKAEMRETNTCYAQGGIAAVTYSPDNNEKHIADTISAGSGINNPEVVKMVVEEGPAEIQQLIDWGVDFDKTDEGKYDLAREGGHTEYRILHHKDITGKEIQYRLTDQVLKNKNITILENHFALDIITQHHLGKEVKRSHKDTECYGAYVLDLKTRDIKTVLAKKTMIATGGIGSVYQTTTNPTVATGDGIAMVYRAKGMIENMEFMQFHPTSLFDPNTRPSFLISEAMRGYGAILKNRKGEDFMPKYDKRGSLAPRDIVARAIDHELKIHGDDFVYLDVTHKDAEKTKRHFPNIYQRCLDKGYDITKEVIPVVPAAHYACGGIKVNINGQSTISHLYAAGEAASTGLHGANRLASNSLLEGIVFANRAAKHSCADINSIQHKEDIPDWDKSGTTYPEERVLITQTYKEMQMILNSYVGIVRSDLRLDRALRRLEIIYKETEELYKKSTLLQSLCELRNMINVGYLIIKMAKERKESCGLHYTLDYPKKEGK
ncbi:MAG: L-aspartate oxidase [Bacteroidales bacterium]|jgi:L-aspartate oxidase|nr:L-aspartate oxidase [Bacteroidales bacterium]